MKMAQPIGIIDHAAEKRYVVRSCTDMTEICGISKNWANDKMNRYESFDFISKANGKLYTLVRMPREDFQGPMSEESKKFVGGGHQGVNAILNRPLNPVTWHKESCCWNCSKSSDYRLCPWVASKHKKKDIPKGCRTYKLARSNHSDLRQPAESIVIVSCPNFEPGRHFGEYDTEGCNRVVYAMCSDTSKQLEEIAKVASRCRKQGYYSDYQSQLYSLRFYGRFYAGSDFGESFFTYLRRKYDIDF